MLTIKKTFKADMNNKETKGAIVMCINKSNQKTRNEHGQGIKFNYLHHLQNLHNLHHLPYIHRIFPIINYINQTLSL